MSRILVTGGAGYIGSHIVRALIESDTPGEVHVLDDLSAGNEKACAPLVHDLPIQETAELASLLVNKRIDCVIHLAAKCVVSESVRDPTGTYDTNVTGTLSVVEAMLAVGVRNLVFASSSSVYSELSPYGRSKAMAERVIRDACDAHPDNLRAIVLRYYNVAGAHESGEIGEHHEPETRLIPLACAAALGRGPLKINGTAIAGTTDGTCSRDYVHVCDVADATIAAANKVATHVFHPTDICSGKNHSVLDVVRMVQAVSGRDVPVIATDPRPGDPRITPGSTAGMTRRLGVEPKRSSLRRIVEDAWRWHSTHPDGYA